MIQFLMYGIICGAVVVGVPLVIIGLMRFRYIRESAVSGYVSDMKVLQQKCSEREEEARHLTEESRRLQEKNSGVSEEMSGFRSKCQAFEERINEIRKELEERDRKIDGLVGEKSRDQARLSELQTKLEAERTQSEEKLKLIIGARDQMKVEFQNLANSIFDEKSKKFSEQSKTNLDLVLNPLKDQIGDFRKRVDAVHTDEVKERQSLLEQIKTLTTLNQQVNLQAENLTKALKGENKTQGNWGEMILERALELSGLKKGSEYDVQVTRTDDEDREKKPDVVVHLPEGRDIIVDSKVSLTDYEEMVSAGDEDDCEKARAAHLVSVRRHIDGLSGKSYEKLPGVNTLDYVLMFMPIEAAFVAAIRKDPGLFEYAYRKRIILVSPSTLLVTLRTIQNMWQSEHQHRNAQEIAKKAAGLYDKFAGFIDTLSDVKKAISSASEKCDESIKQLSSGKGNLVSKVESFRKLGVKPKKNIPPALIEDEEDLLVSDEAMLAGGEIAEDKDD